MSSPEKPFACSAPDCGHTFTTEEHLTSHSKKHEMALQLGQKVNAFPADQTPTPTRFIRNCEEVGLFQELQNVNPFDEGFKRAMEAEGSILISLDSAIAAATSDDALHTPHIFPNLADVPDSGLFTSSTRKHTVTRSSSDDSTTVKHFETIETKLTNEVTIEKHDKKVNPNNKIIIQSNIEISKADFSSVVTSDPNFSRVDKDLFVMRKDVMLTDASKNPVMSQQSLDFAIDSLTSHVNEGKSKELQSEKNVVLIDTMRKNVKNALDNASKRFSKTISVTSKEEDKVEVKRKGEKRRSSDVDNTQTCKDKKSEQPSYEVMLKLPNGDLVHLKSNDNKPNTDTKQKLKDAIENKLKTEIGNKIITDLENKIKSDILKENNLSDPSKAALPILMAEKAIPTLLQITSPQILTKPPYPVAVIHSLSNSIIHPLTHNVIMPLSKIAIPTDKYTNKLPAKKTRRVTKKTKPYKILPEVKTKVVQHKPACAILTQLGGQCSLNCDQEFFSSVISVCNDLTANVAAGVGDVNKKDDGCRLQTVLVKNISDSEPSNNNKIDSNFNRASVSASSDVIDDNATIINDSVDNASINHSNNKSTSVAKNRSGTVEAISRLLNEKRKRLVVNDDEIFKKESRQEAVRRYRSREKQKKETLYAENKELMSANIQLSEELERTRQELRTLKQVLIKHCIACKTPDDLRAQYSMFVEINLQPVTKEKRNT